MAAKFFKQIFAPYIMPALATAFGGPAAGAAAGALGGAINKSTAPGKQSFGDYAGSAAIGGLTGYGIGKGTQGLMGNSGGMGGIGSFLSNLNPFKSGTAYAATGQGAAQSGGSILGKGISTAPGVSNFLNPTQLAQQNAQQSSAGGGLFGGGNPFKNPLLGGLATMIGSQFIKSPKVPQLPQSVIDFQNQSRQGTPIGNLASQRLTEGLNQPFEQVSQEEETAALRQIERSQQEELHQLNNTYKSLRPGTDITSDSSYARDVANLNQRYADLKTDTISQLRRQVRSDFNSTRAQQILSAQGIDQNRLQQLLQSGQIDMEQLVNQFATDDRDRQVLRNYLLNFGGNLTASQLGVDQGMDMNDLLLLQMMMKGGTNA